MNTANETDQETVLDSESLELLGSAQAIANVPSERMASLRERVMQNVDNEDTTAVSFLTIREDEGPWVEIAPLVEKKVLHIDRKNGTESYLLRLQPGAAPGKHDHDEDELCVVLEGDVSFDAIHLKAGDYHFAPKGSSHGVASTVHGAVIFLQTGLAAA